MTPLWSSFLLYTPFRVPESQNKQLYILCRVAPVWIPRDAALSIPYGQDLSTKFVLSLSFCTCTLGIHLILRMHAHMAHRNMFTEFGGPPSRKTKVSAGKSKILSDGCRHSAGDRSTGLGFVVSLIQVFGIHLSVELFDIHMYRV